MATEEDIQQLLNSVYDPVNQALRMSPRPGTYVQMAGGNVATPSVFPWGHWTGNGTGLFSQIDWTGHTGYAAAPEVFELGMDGHITTQAWLAAQGGFTSTYPAFMFSGVSDVARNGAVYTAEAGSATSYLFRGGQGGFDTIGIDWDGSLVWTNAAIPASPSTAQTWDIKLSRASSGLLSLVTGSLNLNGDLAGPLPWTIDLDVFSTSLTNVNWNTLSQFSNEFHGGERDSDGAQNDSLQWTVVLAAGTWTFEMMHVVSTNRGIYTVQIDGVTVGTIDGYNSGASSNVRSAITGITVATTGKHTLKLLMATKNASSTNYVGAIQHATLLRTA